MTNNKIVMVSILIIAIGLLALNPSILDSQAQMYDNRYGYDSNFENDNRYGYDSYYENDNRYGYDTYKVQKINCINTNININGDNTAGLNIGNGKVATAEDGTEGDLSTSSLESNGERYNNGYDTYDKNHKDFTCIIQNNNTNNNIGADDGGVTEPTASLTVKKAIFGCNNIDLQGSRMNCLELQDGSSSWLPCTNPAISNTIFCQNLPAFLFDIEVLDSQNTQLQKFEGSADGTTIQNLQAGTYAVNEIKDPVSETNQLRVSPSVEQRCISNGFTDGGVLFSKIQVPNIAYDICFEYEDGQGNDCSSVTLAPGENKVCTVKNYINIGSNPAT